MRWCLRDLARQARRVGAGRSRPWFAAGAGAWIGVSTGLVSAMSPGIGLVVFLAGAFGFMFAIEKTKNSTAGVPMLLAFTEAGPEWANLPTRNRAYNLW